MDWILVYAGILAVLAGVLCMLRPSRLLRIRTRRRAAALTAAGLFLMVIGAAWPGGRTRPVEHGGLIDALMPVYDFHEVHSKRIHAPPRRIFEAIKSVTPADVRFSGTLIGIRRLPARLMGHRPGSNQQMSRPLFGAVTREDSLRMSEVADREMAMWLIGKFWALTRSERPQVTTTRDFLEFDRPDYAKAVINFLIVPESQGWCRVSTETRILATSPGARRKFTFYWRLIYPGSALLRAMFLDAIKRRAEA